MDYLSIQKDVIEKYRVVIVSDSSCRARMHVHCRDNSRRICKWSPKPSYAATFNLLHEVGHLETWKASMKRCESESAATEWAIAKAREYGLPIKRRTAAAFKQYIKMTYERGLRRGLSKRIKTKLYM